MDTPLLLAIVQVYCNNANTMPHVRADGTRAVVPERYEFHMPCPWGQTAVGRACLACVNHRQTVTWIRPITEAEADVIVDSAGEGGL